MGKWIHRLSEVDRDAKTATCAACGPVGIKFLGKTARCKEALKAYRRAHPDYKARKGSHGLTHKQARLMRSGETCAICGGANGLAVDHNHATGAIRGVLCRRCNTGLGFFRDDPLYLTEAIAYLSREGVSLS